MVELLCRAANCQYIRVDFQSRKNRKKIWMKELKWMKELMVKKLEL